MNLSIIIPVYNNARTIDELIFRLHAALTGRVASLQIILINDGSKDASWAVIEKICAQSPNVVGVNFARNFGQHAGISAGLRFATGDYLVLIDADLEDLPENVPLMLEALTPDIDCVYTTVGQGRLRTTSRLFHRVTASLTRSEIPAGVGTMRLFSRKFADALLRFPERRPVWGPIMHALGFRHVTVRLPEVHGRNNSTYSFTKRVRLAMDFLIANTSIPFTLLAYLSGILFAATLIYAGAILVQYLVMGSSVPSGITLIAFLLLVLFSFNFMFLAIMGLYVHRILIETLGRPVFVVSDTVNSDRQL